MRIEVRRSDTFTIGHSMWLYRGDECMCIAKGDAGRWLGNGRAMDEYDIPHALAFELMKCMGHDPVYVDEAVPSPDPHEEWREAVTEFVSQWRGWSQGDTHSTPTAAATRVIEAAERAKSVTGDGKGGAK